MKVAIRDPETLELVQPGNAETYLAAYNWRRVTQRVGEFSSWERLDQAGQKRKAIVALDQSFADYAARVSELLGVLADVEDRSQLAIYDDIARIRLDGIAVRSEHPAAADGSIPVYAGASLVENAVELVEAAACSTVEPRSRFLARRPKQANEYAERLRMGQTGRGSYIVNIYSPLQIPSDPSNVSQISLPMDNVAPIIEGFGRRAVKTLFRALEATKAAVAESATTGKIDPFVEAVREGVSANLLGAVAGLLGDDAPRVEVSIRWSPCITPPTPEPISVVFERNELESIERAEEHFRQQTPDESVFLHGHVVQLNRTSEMFGDRIFLESLINERKTRVALILWNDDYRKAMLALEQRKELQCRGRLVKFGRSYRLEEPRDVEIMG